MLSIFEINSTSAKKVVTRLPVSLQPIEISSLASDACWPVDPARALKRWVLSFARAAISANTPLSFFERLASIWSDIALLFSENETRCLSAFAFELLTVWDTTSKRELVSDEILSTRETVSEMPLSSLFEPCASSVSSSLVKEAAASLWDRATDAASSFASSVRCRDQSSNRLTSSFDVCDVARAESKVFSIEFAKRPRDFWDEEWISSEWFERVAVKDSKREMKSFWKDSMKLSSVLVDACSLLESADSRSLNWRCSCSISSREWSKRSWSRWPSCFSSSCRALWLFSLAWTRPVV